MMKTLNKMKDKLQREGVELRSAREQVLDLSSRINDIAVSNAASFMLQTCSVMVSPDKWRRQEVSLCSLLLSKLLPVSCADVFDWRIIKLFCGNQKLKRLTCVSSCPPAGWCCAVIPTSCSASSWGSCGSASTTDDGGLPSTSPSTAIQLPTPPSTSATARGATSTSSTRSTSHFWSPAPTHPFHV